MRKKSHESWGKRQRERRKLEKRLSKRKRKPIMEANGNDNPNQTATNEITTGRTVGKVLLEESTASASDP
jgi:hypothetical protein